jgi:hypothetical protein
MAMSSVAWPCFLKMVGLKEPSVVDEDVVYLKTKMAREKKKRTDQMTDKDPWKHRSAGMRCNTCMWFVPKIVKLQDGKEASIVGRCRRHAPTMSGFPVVYVNDWCGDHKLDEEQVS